MKNIFAYLIIQKNRIHHHIKHISLSLIYKTLIQLVYVVSLLGFTGDIFIKFQITHITRHYQVSPDYHGENTNGKSMHQHSIRVLTSIIEVHVY